MVQMTSDPMMPIGMSFCGFFGFLRGNRHGVESDVGEEDDAGASQDAAPPILAEGCRCSRG